MPSATSLGFSFGFFFWPGRGGLQSGYNCFFPSNLRRPIKLALNSPTRLSSGRVHPAEGVSWLSSHKFGLSLLSDSVHGSQLNT